jgi:hypothetical protein
MYDLFFPRTDTTHLVVSRLRGSEALSYLHLMAGVRHIDGVSETPNLSTCCHSSCFRHSQDISSHYGTLVGPDGTSLCAGVPPFCGGISSAAVVMEMDAHSLSRLFFLPMVYRKEWLP